MLKQGKLYVLALVVATSFTASHTVYSQTQNRTPDKKEIALASYYKCVQDYAKRITATKEAPGDIADAAAIQTVFDTRYPKSN